MRDSIKKILKEDFDWAKDIPEYEPLTNINDPKIREFKPGDKTTYNGKPVTIVSTNPNFIKVQYDKTGGIFELVVNPGMWKSDPDYYKSLHAKDVRVRDLNEDFDWVAKDTVPFLEIGEPLKVQNPKNQYRLHVQHGVGEDNGTWIPNWMNYDPTRHLDMLVRHIKILSWLQSNYREGIWGLADAWLEGEEWVLSPEDNKNIRNIMEKEGWTIEEEDDQIRDYIWEWLNDELMDYGLREYDSYHQDDASIEDWRVTYFDEFGVEHAVKVNLPK